jgi:hypothetical protein
MRNELWALLAGVCLTTVVVSLAAAFALWRNREANRQSARLAAACGLAPIAGTRSPVFYGGTYRGRPVVFAHAFVKETLGGADGAAAPGAGASRSAFGATHRSGPRSAVRPRRCSKCPSRGTSSPTS